ncbi:unnamed protein product, partial [Polarella glacialis]
SRKPLNRQLGKPDPRIMEVSERWRLRSEGLLHPDAAGRAPSEVTPEADVGVGAAAEKKKQKGNKIGREPSGTDEGAAGYRPMPRKAGSVLAEDATKCGSQEAAKPERAAKASSSKVAAVDPSHFKLSLADSLPGREEPTKQGKTAKQDLQLGKP